MTPHSAWACARAARGLGEMKGLACAHPARMRVIEYRAELDNTGFARRSETADGVRALVLELVEGPTLADRRA